MTEMIPLNVAASFFCSFFSLSLFNSQKFNGNSVGSLERIKRSSCYNLCLSTKIDPIVMHNAIVLNQILLSIESICTSFCVHYSKFSCLCKHEYLTLIHNLIYCCFTLIIVTPPIANLNGFQDFLLCKKHPLKCAGNTFAFNSPSNIFLLI